MIHSKQTLLGTAYLLVLGLSTTLGYFGLTSRDSVLAISFNLRDFYDNHKGDNSQSLSSSKLCEMMKLHRKQKKICRRGRGIAESLMEAMRTSLIECQYQFQHERWNCSLGDPYRKNLLKRGFKETSFLYAISSASLVHAFARACSRGRLDRCTCDESKHLKNEETWQWGGCGDNIKFGLKFTRRFLRRAKRKGKDVRAKVNQHNSRLGIKVVKNYVETKCKCHGVSGSCTVQTCWRQLSPFHEIGQVLKQKYENAYKVDSNTNDANGKYSLTIKSDIRNLITQNDPPRTLDMVYIENPPDFCLKSMYSQGTRGRECNKEKTCDSTCCGRGYNVMTKQVIKPCKCQVIWCCEFDCQKCLTQQEVYTCK